MRVNTPSHFSHLRSNFKNHFQLDRHRKRQTGNAQHDAGRYLLFPENLYQYFRSCIGHLRMAIDTPSLTTRLTLSSEPKWCRAAASTFRQAMAAAVRPSSMVSSAPSRPR
jgi:hypothetical protein